MVNIRSEKERAESLANPILEKINTTVASRVPSPLIDMGITEIIVAMLTVPITFKKDTSMCSALVKNHQPEKNTDHPSST